MGSENAKVRVGIYIEKAILEQADGLLETANVRSRNEFVAEALKFYMGYLLAGKAENYFLQSLASVLTGTVQDSAGSMVNKGRSIDTPFVVTPEQNVDTLLP